ncbi:MAG: DEAD/DEAH box helicase [Fuerstiella sp.]
METTLNSSALDCFHPCTRDWFRQAFAEPTQVQCEAWPPIANRLSTLLLAPTGSGKTLAAFLATIDRLFFDLPADPSPNSRDAFPGIRCVYISPLKALGVDVDRNLRAPLAGLRAFAERHNVPHQLPRVAVRSGDTPARDRALIVRQPPEILITTPESLYLMLTSKASTVLRTVETVIVDEIHALAGTKRGSHLFVSLERLEHLRSLHRPADAGHSPCPPLQRIGLSATQRPLHEIARLLGGGMAPGDPAGPVVPRPVTIVDASARRSFNLTIETPAEDQSPDQPVTGEEDIPIGPAASAPSLPSVWPSIHPRLVELIRRNRSTIIFVNSRRLAERLAAAVNELAEEELALAHHGSLAKDQRASIEDRLKRGELRAMVATSSMELGIDMGAVDLVIQIEAPPSIASGTQRIGRAGHHVGAVSTGVIFPKYKADLLACSAATGAMLEGWVEETSFPRNPLDVLAQQIVAITSRESVHVDELYRVVRGAAPFFELPLSSFVSVLDLLSGRYPSDEFSELRPRLNWDRISGIVSPRRGAQRLAILNAGTIPDRGLYGVYLVGNDGESGGRVGELDEEMVFECRPGDVFLLGASSWRVMDITRDRVLVVPAPGEPGRMPFWRGDGPGRPLEFGRAIGQLAREVTTSPRDESIQRLTQDHGLRTSAAESLLQYLQDQIDATGELPSDRCIVIESFLDEVGDWRIVVLSPFGARVHAPWALLVAARLRQETSDDVDLMWTDDGIVFRIPEAQDVPDVSLFFPEPDDVEADLIREIGGTALFAAKFRENAARSLLLPRRSPNRRTPLWLQRRRSNDLLKVATRFRSFPMLMETYRECLRDVFDMPGFIGLLRDVKTRAIRVHCVRSEHPSPFAGAVLFNFVGNFIYDGDAPLAERRAQTLALDHAQLRELLGTVDFRELFDSDVVSLVAAELQRTQGWQLRHADDLHSLLLDLGALSLEEIQQRCDADDIAAGNAQAWLSELLTARRAFSCQVNDSQRFAAAEDAGRLRDALGVMPPPGLADAFLEPVLAALIDLVSQYARTHVPFTAADVSSRLGLGVAPVLAALTALAERERVIEGEFLPGGRGQEWCDVNVLRTLKRRSLAALRKEVEPVEPAALVRFLPDWHGITRPRRGLDGLLDAIEQLQGAPLPASTLENEILPARIQGFRPADLDELCVQGEVIWRGFDSTGSSDGRIGLFLTDHYRSLAPPVTAVANATADQLRELLRARGALFFDQIAAEVRDFPHDLLQVLWQLVWSGEVTNDTLTPLRSLRTAAAGRGRQERRGGRAFRSRRQGRLPGSEGRWTLLPNIDVSGIVNESGRGVPTMTERQAAIAAQLVQRHGVLTKEMLAREEVAGGFAGLYPVLKAMEEAGKVRRGYFVAGLGAAQFALPGAEDQLRSFRDSSQTDSSQTDSRQPGSRQPGSEQTKTAAVVLAATDPACPWGNALSWPDTPETGRPQRVAGARVVVHDGQLLGYLNRTRQHLQTFLSSEPKTRDRQAGILATSLAAMAKPGNLLLLNKIDGGPPSAAVISEALLHAGFRPSTKGYLHKGLRVDA